MAVALLLVQWPAAACCDTSVCINVLPVIAVTVTGLVESALCRCKREGKRVRIIIVVEFHVAHSGDRVERRSRRQGMRGARPIAGHGLPGVGGGLRKQA